MRKYYIAESIYIFSFIIVFLASVALSALAISMCHFGLINTLECILEFLQTY